MSKTGIVKQLFSDKNYGFITVSGDKASYMFHKDDFLGHWGDLAMDFQNRIEALPVVFEEDSTPRGPRARNVKRTDFPNIG